MDTTNKRTKGETRISLSHLTFEDAVRALVRDEEPKRGDSRAEESCSTTEHDPSTDASEPQTAPRP